MTTGPGRAWRVLVTDGDYKHTLGIVRTLAGRAEVTTISSRRLAIAGRSRFTRNLVGPQSGEDLVAFLDRTIAAHRFDQVIPVGAAACETLAPVRDRWLPTTGIVLPPAAAMDRALDKLEMNALAERLGLPAPRTAAPRSADDGEIASAAAAVGAPLVIKARREGAWGVAYVDRPEDAVGAYRRYLARGWTAEEPLPILQQRVTGTGFGMFATYQEGRVRRTMAHRRVREVPPTGGPSAAAELALDPSIVDHGRTLLDALEWHGVAMVEFKRSESDGRYYLMEVNPKLWGSLDLAIAAGVDFPGDLVAIARGRDLPLEAGPTRPFRYCWPISGDLRYLAMRPHDWRPVLRDWADPRVGKNLRWDDPVPHLVELARTARFVAALARGGR